MKNYEKPVLLVNEELAEGVYAASGSGCWSVGVSFTSHADKCEVEINGTHTNSSAAPHTANLQVIITFNKQLTTGSNIVTLNENVGTANPTESKIWNITVYAADGDNQGLSITNYTWECLG